MRDTWFEGVMFRLEKLDLPIMWRNEIVVLANRRLGLKICDLWGEDYDKLREGCFEQRIA